MELSTNCDSLRNRAAFIITVLAFLLTASPATATPMLVIDEPTHDLGSVVQGEKAQHTFVLRNLGNEALVISKVQVACGCTAATLANSTIPPGKTAQVKTTFDTTAFAGFVTKNISRVIPWTFGLLVGLFHAS